MKFNKSDLIGFIINLFNLKIAISQECTVSKTNEPGNCISFHSCLKAQTDLRNFRIHPDICYFEKLDPIVCCPISSLTNMIPISCSSGGIPSAPYSPSQITKEPLTKVPLPIIPKENTIERISVKKCKEFYNVKKVEPPKELVFSIAAVGGEKAKAGEFPYMAAIGWERYDKTIEFKCGGFLVEKNYVITAAHCASLGGAAPIVVRTGGSPLNDSNSTNIPIEQIFVHPDYRNEQTYNDIAIFKLKLSSSELPACLWQTDQIKGYTQGTAVGYGHTQFAGSGSNDLVKVKLFFYINTQCSMYYKPQSEYPFGLVDSQLCAGDPDGIMDTCQGDSGGPILIKTGADWPYVIGVTSFGSGCAGQTPSVYTRLSSYIDWIEPIVWQ